jgi:hypothetical protein
MTLDRPDKRRLAKRMALEKIRPGEILVLAFDAEATPCGCAPYRRAGVPCVSVAWRVVESRPAYALRCLACGAAWEATISLGAWRSGLANKRPRMSLPARSRPAYTRGEERRTRP